MLRNTTQAYLVYQEKTKQEFIKFLDLLNICFWVCVPFAIFSFFQSRFFNSIRIFDALIFFALVIILCLYWLFPNKKRMEKEKRETIFI